MAVRSAPTPLRRVIAVGALCCAILALAVTFFAGPASAKSASGNPSPTATTKASATSNGSSTNLLAALLEGLGKTVNTTVSDLLTTVGQTANAVTTVVGTLLGGSSPSGPSTSPVPPPTSVPPSSTSITPPSSASASRTPVTTGLSNAPTTGISLDPPTSTSRTVVSTHPTSKPRPELGAANRLLSAFSTSALLLIVGAFVSGVAVIVFGAGHRGRRAS